MGDASAKPRAADRLQPLPVRPSRCLGVGRRLVGGNLWRTTGDIRDNWESMSANRFQPGRARDFAGPATGTIPDMLEVGNGGMTDEEYRTHMSLWSILAAPLMAGNDLSHHDTGNSLYPH